MYQQIKQACAQLLADLETMPELEAMKRYPWLTAVTHSATSTWWAELHTSRKVLYASVSGKASPRRALEAAVTQLLQLVATEESMLVVRRAQAAAELAAIDEALAARGKLTDHESEPGRNDPNERAAE